MSSSPDPTYGLVLTGGGARGAYQAGVFKAAAELAPDGPLTFPVITGVSVGALNAAGLAASCETFECAAKELNDFWLGLNTAKVFDTRMSRMAFTGLRLALAEFLPTLFRKRPKSLLDNTPLKTSLAAAIDFKKIRQAIKTGDLKAVSVTCSGYSSGHAVTFFESSNGIEEWHRARRDGQHCQITLDHIMASSALPLLFPAVKIDTEYFGDGALRSTSPLAPAIHLGATRLLIVGTRDTHAQDLTPRSEISTYPSIGELGGYALDTIFNDNLESDLERLERINGLLSNCSQGPKKEENLKPIEILSLNPSRSLRKIALNHVHEMPWSLRWILKRQGSGQALGRLESYLLFESGYIQALIDLGYADTMARKDEVTRFLNR